MGNDQDIIKSVTAQRRELSRDELQRLRQENYTLKQQLGQLRADAFASSANAERSPVTQLQIQIDALRKDRDDALALAATRQAEADSWKTRYEQRKPQLAESATMSLQLSDTIKQELIQFLGGEDPAKFCAFMTGLPATVVPESFNQESHVVFKNTKKFPCLSKAAVKACIGGFAFFEALLVWCTPPSQHACVVFPENEYNPKPTVEGAPKWSKTTSEWPALAGQQRELFYIDGENISYAGTFICHAGPKGANVSALGDTLDDTLLAAIAAKTLHLDMKNPKTRSSIFKTYPPLLANIYRESSSPATVQLLGLQRVGFNQTLFDILKAASRKRDRAAAFPDLPGGPSSDGVGSPAKRAALGFEDFAAI